MNEDDTPLKLPLIDTRGEEQPVIPEPSPPPELRIDRNAKYPDDPDDPLSRVWQPLLGAAIVVGMWRSHLRMGVPYRETVLAAFFEPELGDHGETVNNTLFGFLLKDVVKIDEIVGQGDNGEPVILEFTNALQPARTTVRWRLDPHVPKRPVVSETLRRTIMVRDRGACRYCHELAVFGVLDHVVPHSAGGPTTADNLVWACQTCNSKKSTYLWLPADL